MNKAAPALCASSDITKHEHKARAQPRGGGGVISCLLSCTCTPRHLSWRIESIDESTRHERGGADGQTVTYRRTAFEGIIHECASHHLHMAPRMHSTVNDDSC